MKVVAGLASLLVSVLLSQSCFEESSLLFCPAIPTAFPPGYSSVVMSLHNVGEINSTVFCSNDLSSVTRLRISDAEITAITEGAFGCFQSLKDLVLNDNLLTGMNPNWLGRPDILSKLDLTGNQIEVVNEFMFSGVTGLTRLRLNKNRIQTIDPKSFLSQTALAELDLSENRMTRVSPQAFGSLESTRIRLDGNPWDCSCGAEDFVDFLKELLSRSLLDREVEVTCATPPSLRDRPVWNVSVCVTSPQPRPPSVTQKVKPTDVLTRVPPSSAPFPARPTSQTSVHPEPTDNLPTATTPTLKTETHVTSPTSMTGISPHPKPSVQPTPTLSMPTGKTETHVTSRPSSDTNNVCTAVVVIVVLSSLLFVVCFLALLYRRKHSNKTVMPGSPNENRSESKGDSSVSQSRSPEDSDKKDNHWDSEIGWTRSFSGVRAKSANAILSTSPCCAPVKDRVTLQTETGIQCERKPKLGCETEVDGGFEKENQTTAIHVSVGQAAGDRNLDKDLQSDVVNTDAVPYLSIGTDHNKQGDFNKQFSDSAGQRSQRGKRIARISTWPPTAIQWQARCKMMEEEGSDVFTVRKLPGEVNNVFNTAEHPHSEEKMKGNQTEVKINDAQMKVEPSPSLNGAHAQETIQDSVAVRQTVSETKNQIQEKLGPSQHQKPAEKRKSGNKTEQRTEAKRPASRQRAAEDRSSGSKAPSGGNSPDDETLLSGNEYAFMDLLHEVAQNNGRWTREKWRQKHVNMQRR